MILSILAWLFIQLLGHLLQGPLQPSALRPHKRSLSLWLLQTGLFSLPYLFLLLLTARPLLSGLLTSVLIVTPVIVNHAKYRALREPLVFSDFFLYIQVFTHPRLFLPFLNLPLTLLASASGLIAVSLILILENTLALASVPIALLLAITLVFCWYYPSQLNLVFEPIDDIQRLGFFNSLLISARQAASKQRQQSLKKRLAKASPFHKMAQLGKVKPGVKPDTPKADIIVIQSESFCDIRTISPAVHSQVLQHFDRICHQATHHGPLKVPAWGANTLRPEFAFLSGVDNALLEHYRYNPYQYLQHLETATLASYLRQQGYYTLCLHPNHAAFFKRDRVFPLMGFDEFIDIRQFSNAPTDGPYISDAAVTDKLVEILQQKRNNQPLFIFAITMENHGPLHLEPLPVEELNSLYQGTPPKAHHDLSVYLQHLRNADAMLKRLTDYLTTSPRPAQLCWYGDHVPSMPDVYTEMEVETLDSYYLIWNNHHKTQQEQRDATAPKTAMRIEELAKQLITSNAS